MTDAWNTYPPSSCIGLINAMVRKLTDLPPKQAVLKAHDEGRLVHCTWPGADSLAISLERHMVDDAMTEWRRLDADDRWQRMQSIRKEIKRITKRMKQKRASPKEMDGFAADIALFIGHELLYADGERYLIKGPTRQEIESYDRTS